MGNFIPHYFIFCMRHLFFAVRLPKPIIREIDKQFIHPLHAFPFLKLVESDTLHITTHFVGDVIEEQCASIADDFLHADFSSMQEIILGGEKNLDRFGQRTLFLHVEDLYQCLSQLHETCYALFPQNNYMYARNAQYYPHVTLARNPSAQLLSPIEKKFNQITWEKHFTPTAISLMESIPLQGKKKYVERAHVRLSQGTV